MAHKRPAGKADKDGDTLTLVASNRKAYHDYFVTDEIEAGVQLVGTEVKSLRAGACQLQGAYVRIDPDAALVQMHGATISEYKSAGPLFQHPPQRTRRLLLHKREIAKLRRALHERGTTLIPLKVYFKQGRAKVLVGVCKGKKAYDKRASTREKDVKRDLARLRSR